MNITSIAVTGANLSDFARTTTCGATLAAGATCIVSVTFSPSATGARNAAVTINDDAPGNPHSVALTGTGVTPPPQTPEAVVTPTTLAFGDVPAGSISPASNVSVQNTGTASLVIGTTPITGDFVKGPTDTCTGQIIAPNTSCSINVRFAPGTAGAKTGTLTINDNTATSPHSVALTGNGTQAAAPLAVVSPTSLAFGSQTVGTTSTPAKAVTMTNSGNAPMTLTVGLAGANPGDYVTTGTCPLTLAAGSSCTINVAFKPTVAGARAAVLRFTDDTGNVSGSTQDVALSGTGAAAPAPAISASPNPLAFGTAAARGGGGRRTAQQLGHALVVDGARRSAPSRRSWRRGSRRS